MLSGFIRHPAQVDFFQPTHHQATEWHPSGFRPLVEVSTCPGHVARPELAQVAWHGPGFQDAEAILDAALARSHVEGEGLERAELVRVQRQGVRVAGQHRLRGYLHILAEQVVALGVRQA